MYMNKPANFEIAQRVTGYAGDFRDIPTFLTIAKPDIPKWAEKYVEFLDTATTGEVCKCEWNVHPDDLKIRPLHCRNCSHPREKHDAMGLCSGVVKSDDSIDGTDECPCASYDPRRVKMGDVHEHCPVHTPIGKIMGFFEYVFSQKTCRTPTCPNKPDPNFDGYCCPEHATDEGEMTGEPKGILNEDITKQD